MGNASTQKLHFGKVMGMKDVGPLAAKADFKIDISKPRTAVMRRKLGFKLPIGKVSATQMHKLKVSHGRIKFHKMSDEARQAKRERKEARKAERQAKREAKKAEKDAKKAAKRNFLHFLR